MLSKTIKKAAPVLRNVNHLLPKGCIAKPQNEQRNLSSGNYQFKNEEVSMIESNIINKLQHGKIMMWTHEESEQTQKTRDMLHRHGIIFEEE